MYKLCPSPIDNFFVQSVKRLSDNAFIPFVDGNGDYEEYKKWLAKGNTPEPADSE
jgi:hypothetical protein